jgi:hypothetical protein
VVPSPVRRLTRTTSVETLSQRQASQVVRLVRSRLYYRPMPHHDMAAIEAVQIYIAINSRAGFGLLHDSFSLGHQPWGRSMQRSSPPTEGHQASRPMPD